MGVALGCRHPGVAKYLLDNADMNTLRDQQSRSGVPGIVNPGVPNPCLPENVHPGPPVLSPLDRTAVPSSEHEVIVRPGVPRPQPLGCLPLAMLSKEIQDRGQALERELALALTLRQP